MNHLRKNIEKYMTFFTSSFHKRYTILLFIMVMSFQSAAQAMATPAKGISQYLGDDWTLTNIQGQSVTLSKYQGQPVILVFWATWCPYCKKLLPGMQKLHEKYAQEGLKIIAVNIKEDWKPEVYWRNHEYQFDAVLSGDDIADKYGIKGTPGVVFIAPSGEVLNVSHFSDPDHPSLEKFAQHFLN